jgi:hypothetical protein
MINFMKMINFMNSEERLVWREVVVAVAQSPFCTQSEVAVDWADRITMAFRERSSGTVAEGKAE